MKKKDILYQNFVVVVFISLPEANCHRTIINAPNSALAGIFHFNFRVSNRTNTPAEQKRWQTMRDLTLVSIRPTSTKSGHIAGFCPNPDPATKICLDYVKEVNQDKLCRAIINLVAVDVDWKNIGYSTERYNPRRVQCDVENADSKQFHKAYESRSNEKAPTNLRDPRTCAVALVLTCRDLKWNKEGTRNGYVGVVENKLGRPSGGRLGLIISKHLTTSIMASILSVGCISQELSLKQSCLNIYLLTLLLV